MEEKKKKSYKPIIYLTIIGILLIACGYLYSTGYFDYYKELLGVKTNNTTETNKTGTNNTNETVVKKNTLLEDETVKLLYSYVQENKNDASTYTFLKTNTTVSTLDEGTILALAYRQIPEDKIKFSNVTCAVNIESADYKTAIDTIFGATVNLKNTNRYSFSISTKTLTECGNYLTIGYNTTKKKYTGTVSKKDVPTTFVLSELTDAKKNDTNDTNTTGTSATTKSTITLTESYVVVKYTYDTTKKTYTYNIYNNLTSQTPIETKKDVASIDNLKFETYKDKASKSVFTFEKNSSNKYNFISSNLGE